MKTLLIRNLCSS